MYFPLFVGVLYLSLYCYALLSVHYYFAITLKRKRKLVALLLLSYRCIITINVLWLFLTVPWVSLQYVIVVFPDHTHLRFVTDGEKQQALPISFTCNVCFQVVLLIEPVYEISNNVAF